MVRCTPWQWRRRRTSARVLCAEGNDESMPRWTGRIRPQKYPRRAVRAQKASFRNLLYNQAIGHGLAGQDAGFAGMAVLPDLAQPQRAHRRGDRPPMQDVGGVDVGIVEAGVVRNHLQQGAMIGGNGSAVASASGTSHSRSCAAQVHRAGPDGRLIVEDVRGGLRTATVFGLAAGSIGFGCGASGSGSAPPAEKKAAPARSNAARKPRASTARAARSSQPARNSGEDE